LGKLKTKRKHASKFLQREKIGKQKKVETKERNGLPDAATVYQEQGTRIKYMESASPRTQTEQRRQSKKKKTRKKQ
jgi:hypothetical protein